MTRVGRLTFGGKFPPEPFARGMTCREIFVMVTRLLVAFVAMAALAVFAGTSLAKEEAGDTHSGVVVSAGEGKLTMSDKDGKNEHTHDVAATAKVSCDGKECKLEDLKKGASVKVTTKDKKAIKIEASIKKAKN